ncbi:hypothetical protein GAYE_SCF40G5439 [Galdieria yellowstonensis]|uniref:C2 domain-containing protein n=1 Tax=Galdieria yellowstonensis TaxID=3028027 RepID=A0AAV9IJ96_9RHOD|nr:hypothetical protein GAYE_SCF40G5439 [Galdieria yellowstonensis]
MYHIFQYDYYSCPICCFGLGCLVGILWLLVVRRLLYKYYYDIQGKNSNTRLFSDRKGPFQALQYPLYENMESALWLNRVIGKLWEKLEPVWSDLILKELQQLAKKYQPSFLKDVAITHFTLGRHAPELYNIKCFRTCAANTILLDADIDWLARSSEIRVAATLFGIKPPLLSVRKISVHAKLRLQLVLNEEEMNSHHICQSLDLSCVQQPQVQLEIIPLASGIDLMNIPAFRSWLYHLFTVRVFEGMLFPKKIPIYPISSSLASATSSTPSSSSWWFYNDSYKNASYPPDTDGILTIRILSAQISTTIMKYSECNPFITIRLGSQTVSTHKTCRTNQPIWEEKFELLVSHSCRQWIHIRLYHSPQGLLQWLDALGRDILIGSGWLPLEVCKEDAVDKTRDIWLPLTCSFSNISANVHLLYSYEKIWDSNALLEDRNRQDSSFPFHSLVSSNNNNNNSNNNNDSSLLKGWIQIHLLEAYQLHHYEDQADHFSSNVGGDVRCVLEWGSQKLSFSTILNETCPVWNAFAEFEVYDIQKEYLTLTVMDQDPFAKEAFIGRAFICIDRFGDIAPKEYFVAIHDKRHQNDPKITGWIRLWLALKALLQDEDYHSWTQSGNYFVIEPTREYWNHRMLSSSSSSTTNSIDRNNLDSIHLFRQLENLNWTDTFRLVTRTTPLSLWRMASRSLETIFHPSLSDSIESTREESTDANQTHWMITFQTGDCWGAGTNLSVWIQLWDENNNSSPRFLFSNSDGAHFRRGQRDTFMVSVDCLAL